MLAHLSREWYVLVHYYPWDVVGVILIVVGIVLWRLRQAL